MLGLYLQLLDTTPIQLRANTVKWFKIKQNKIE